MVARWRHWSLIQYEMKPKCSYATMAERSKQRKVDAENRQFNKEWPDKWLFVLPVGGMKPMCLTCNATVAVVKSSSVKRHYETTHKARFDVKFPPGCSARKEKVARLQHDYERQTDWQSMALHYPTSQSQSCGRA